MTCRLLIIGCSMVLASALSGADEPNRDGEREKWTLPRTAWGTPDLRGVWDFRTITPLERPQQFGAKKVLTAEEAAEFRTQELQRLNKDRRPSDGISVEQDLGNAYNQFWWDYGNELTEDHRTSLIVDPADGRIPALTPVARERYDAMEAAKARPPNGPEDRGVWERCILGFNAGPPYSPSAYNNNVHIFQTPGYVALLVEMVNDARIVPLDGRPHLPHSIRQWRGDARGHWAGDTLVVESKNFTDETSFQGSGRNMRLIERFTRVGPDRLLYEYTVDDPESFTETWTVAIPMKRTDLPMFEYACHEGNYSMVIMLEAARAAEKEATSSQEPNLR